MKILRVGMFGLTLALPMYAPAHAQTGQDLVQQALVMEQAEGNLRAAIQLYGRIVNEFSTDRGLVARALVQMGGCHEKLGSLDAERAYQRVVSEFADQPDMVAEARARLTALHAAAAADRGTAARNVVSVWDVGQDAFRAVDASPDGRRIAYINMSDGGVYTYDIGSGERRRVAVGVPTYWNFFPQWSPDGRRVAFSQQNRQTQHMDIRIVDLAAGEVTVVPGSAVQGWTDVEEWSRDGRYLLCNPGEDSLGVIAVTGGTMTVVTDSAVLGNGTLSPDGRSVAYAAGALDNARIYVQALAGGVPRQIAWAPGRNIRPRWAPDGRAIAYQRDNGIWVIPMTDGAPSGDARLVVAVTDFVLDKWGDAGLYYVQNTGLGRRSLAPHQLAMDPATGHPAPIGLQILPAEHPDSIGGFAWSPDMRRVVFGHARLTEISVYSADTRTTRTYDPGPLGRAVRPSWSRDGREVVYEPYGIWAGGEGSTMVALDIATGQARELFPRVPNAVAMSLSADGHVITYYRLGPPDQSQPDPISPVLMLTAGGLRVSAVVVGHPGESGAIEVATAGGPGEIPFSGYTTPRLSPQGDRVLYVRQARVDEAGQRAPRASTLWVVGSDGRGARQLGAAAFIRSAVWDPSGRLIAYSGKSEMPDGPTAFVRVVELATGVEMEVPLPGDFARNLGMWEQLIVADWSSDGSRLGILPLRSGEAPWEYWVVQGLLEGGR